MIWSTILSLVMELCIHIAIFVKQTSIESKAMAETMIVKNNRQK